MESTLFKLALGFLCIIFLGLIIVASTGQSPRQKMEGSFLLLSTQLNRLAAEKCSTAVKEETGVSPYAPSVSDSDHMSTVTLVWNNFSGDQQVECRYIMDQGVTLLRIGDHDVISKEPPKTVVSVQSSHSHEAHHSLH